MNPIHFKAHIYLAGWVELLTDPSSQSVAQIMDLLAIFLASNLLWAAGLPWLLRKLEKLKLSPIRAYWMSLPASFLYAPLMLTLIQDVLGHSFEFRNRWFLLLMILVSSQMLAAFYAFALRHPRSGAPIGLESGLAVSLFLLLISMPAVLILIGLNVLVPFFEPRLNSRRAQTNPMKPLRGFTLIELMITLAVAAILLTVGIPSFRELIEKYRISSQTNMLVGALQLARSEAIKRGSNLVILCKTSDGSSCSSSANWKDGWLLFADKNADKVYSAGTDDLIRRYDAMPKLAITTGNSFQCWIGFAANGYTEGGGTSCAGGAVGNDTFSICAASTTATQRGRSIVINKIGRIRTEDKTCT